MTMAQVRAFNPPQPADSQVAALKLPPHSIEAEQSLIGGLLIDNAAWDRIGDVVRETDFYRDDHRRIFRHIGKLIQMGRPADVVTVYESIEQSNEVDQTGGLGYLGRDRQRDAFGCQHPPLRRNRARARHPAPVGHRR
jgi:replicative DNA helicase